MNNLRRVTRMERSSLDPLEDIPCRIYVVGATARLSADELMRHVVHGTLPANEEGRRFLGELITQTNWKLAITIGNFSTRISQHQIRNCVLRHRRLRSHTGICGYSRVGKSGVHFRYNVHIHCHFTRSLHE